METATAVENKLIPFSKINEGEFFFGGIMVFFEAIIVNLQISGIIPKKDDAIIQSCEKNPDYHIMFLPIKGTENDKMLSICVNKKGEIQYGTFVIITKDEKMAKLNTSEFMEMGNFSKIFLNIVEDLK